MDFYEKNEVVEMDIHWRPQVLLCHPCRFNYSYVIKFENLAPESNRLLHYVQTHMKAPLAKKLVFPNKKRSSAQDSLTQNAMKKIPQYLVEVLRQIYADDFLLYDYDPFLYKGYSEL